MEITHKTGVVEKIDYIKRVGKINQKQIAKELDLSPKTISLWVNRKSKPSGELMQRLNDLYDKITARTTSKSSVRQIIEGVQAREADTVDEQFANEEERVYYEVKQFVHEVEKENYSRIYLFPSKGNTDDEWYKTAGRSLLFYKYYLAPRLGREVNIQSDTDKYRKFKYGVGSARWGKKLIAEAKGLKYDVEVIDYGIIVVELGKTYTKKEFRELVQLSEADRIKARRMIKPKLNYPKVIAEINELNRLLPPKVKKLAEPYRSIYGPELLKPAVELVKIYHRMANGRMERHDAKLEMLERTDDLAAMLTVIDENNFIPMTARTRMGENIVKIRLEIEEAL